MTSQLPVNDPAAGPETFAVVERCTSYHTETTVILAAEMWPGTPHVNGKYQLTCDSCGECWIEHHNNPLSSEESAYKHARECRKQDPS